MEERKVDCESMNIGWIEVSNPRITKSIYNEGMEKELAFHEAGHFVLSCLLIKHIKDFTSIKFAISCVKKVDANEGEWNVVHGVAPKGFTKSDIDHPSKMRSFYTKDKKRFIGKVISTLAGLATYPEFIKKTEYIVGYPNKDKKVIQYLTFRDAYSKGGYSDLEYIKIWLGKGVINLYPWKRYEFICQLMKETQRLMKHRSIRDSIIYIHKQLIKNKCKKITGYRINKLIKKVQRLTNKVPFMDLLNKYEQELIKQEQAYNESLSTYCKSPPSS